eukprot:TRINITY_DN39428_c0_g1_i1.p1 TRINITY_DN39428_c0_g1~~TRINITY_DN39428_c0_g1_i1.p1  ORF type:complete len:649 (+),score=183.77 TRINITY_DN39428_c0_g1_i1:43-1989(+)
MWTRPVRAAIPAAFRHIRMSTPPAAVAASADTAAAARERYRQAEATHEASLSCRFVDDKVNIVVRLEGQQFAFDRSAEEQSCRTLERIGKKMQQPLLGPIPKKRVPKPKKGQPPPPPEPPMLDFSLTDAAGAETAAPGLPNTYAWRRASAVRITPSTAGAEAAPASSEKEWSLRVIVDPPVCLSAAVETNPIVGVPQLATVELAGCTADETELQWWVGEGDEATLVGVGSSCVLPLEAVGKQLSVTVLPRRDAFYGAPVTAKSKHPVSAAPLAPDAAPPPADEDTVRVLTWNVLWDGALTDFGTGKSLYPYVAAQVLEPSRRRQVVLRDTLQWRPQIACLQEMGSSALAEYFGPAFELGDLKASFAVKADTKADDKQKAREGVCVVWDSSRFDLVCERRVRLSGKLGADADPLVVHHSVAHVEKYIQENQSISEVLAKVTTVGQIVVLRDRRTGGQWIVANTHLWFHPHGGHIRALQLTLLLAHMDELRRESMERSPVVRCLLCGDMNMLPESAAWTLLDDGRLPAHHAVWTHAQQFRWGRWDFASGAVDAAEKAGPGERAEGVELALPFQLRDATPGTGPTNVTPGFSGRLDYLYVDADVEVVAAHVPPAEDVLRAEGGGLPSSLVPSDHAALVADLRPVRPAEAST